MAVIWFNSETPLTRFAPNLKAPIYRGLEGSPKLLAELRKQVLKLEETVSKEELVSEVPRDDMDPYPYTQHWKQHNLFWDKPAKDSEHLPRFEMTPELTTLFHIVRKNYLLFLKELNYPRIKIYIHAWANVLRKDQWITKHHHVADNSCYLSGTYYLTTNPTFLSLISPIRVDQKEMFPTVEGSMLFFPSYMPHESTVYTGDDVRISIAYDLATIDSVAVNPWRPHMLLDDPETMEGYEMYLKDRSLTAY